LETSLRYRQTLDQLLQIGIGHSRQATELPRFELSVSDQIKDFSPATAENVGRLFDAEKLEIIAPDVGQRVLDTHLHTSIDIRLDV